MRLLADRTVGRLARYLRMLGHDVGWEPHAGASELLARAEAEDRILLTRDTLLAERRAVRRGAVAVVVVRENRVVDQLRELRSQLGLGRAGPPRCLACNAVLEDLPVEEARKRVPPYVAATQSRFRYCRVCDRITWAATHWEDMERRLKEAGFPVA